MAHIFPISDERMTMMSELLSSLSNYDEDSSVVPARRSHFAPLFKNLPNLNADCLKILMTEEFRCVKNDEYIDGNSVFIFNSSHLDISEHTIPSGQAVENLRYYVGLYFDDLDLSRSFITGSSITASIIRTERDGSYCRTSPIDDRAIAIEILYPKVVTCLEPADASVLQRDNINKWNIRALSATNGIASKGHVQIPFTIKSGADVDIAVDETVSDNEYREIAHDHFNVISRYYPYVKIREYIKPKGDWNYVIYTDDPDYIAIFRTVEIYRSSFRKICSHHIGAVRGCYTSRWGSDPQFYLTASGVLTSLCNSTPNYHYFSGRKSNPQDIIIKYMQRGIDMCDQVLQRIIQDYISDHGIELSYLPFYFGRNIPCSIFAASIEYPLAREKLLEREENARRKAERSRLRAEQKERRRIQMEENERMRAETVRNRENIARDTLVTNGQFPNFYYRESYIGLPNTNRASMSDVQRIMLDDHERQQYLMSLGLPKVTINTRIDKPDTPTI
jgi:hypothetical protein